MKFPQKKTLLILIFTAIGILLIWAFHEGREEFNKEKERERPVKTESRVSIENGQRIVTLEQADQMKSRITAQPLQASSHSEELRVQETVVELEDLPQDIKGRLQLIQKEAVFIQVALPINANLSIAPQRAWVKTDEGAVTAEFVGQTADNNFFYQVPAESFKEKSWIEVSLYLPIGPEVKGVVILADSVVWLDNKAWVYVKKDTDHFVRCEISTAVPVKDGWFVSKDFTAGQEIVTNGAQLLLSEEFRGQLELGGENKENERD